MKSPALSLAMVFSATVVLSIFSTDHVRGQGVQGNLTSTNGSKISLLQIKQAIDQSQSKTDASIKKLDEKLNNVRKEIIDYVDQRVNTPLPAQSRPSDIVFASPPRQGEQPFLTNAQGLPVDGSVIAQATPTLLVSQTGGIALPPPLPGGNTLPPPLQGGSVLPPPLSGGSVLPEPLPRANGGESIDGGANGTNLIGTIRIEGNITINQPPGQNPVPQTNDSEDVRPNIFAASTGLPNQPTQVFAQPATSLFPVTAQSSTLSQVCTPNRVFVQSASTSVLPLRNVDIRDDIFADGGGSGGANPRPLPQRRGNDLLMFEEENRPDFSAARSGVYRSHQRTGLFNSSRTTYRFRN